MSASATISRGLGHFVAGRVVSGLLGVAWLALLVRALSAAQYGVYVGMLALFELLQMASGLGWHAYAGRYLPAAWAHASRAALAADLWRLAAWRLGTLAAAAAATGLAWPFVVPALDWPSPAPGAAAFMAYLLAAGAARGIEVIFESALEQRFIQSLSAARNAARIVAVLIGPATDGPLTAAWVVGLEAVLAVGFVLAGSMRLRSLVHRQRQQAGTAANPAPGLRTFTLQGYASVLLAQVCGIESIKLVLSHGAGPNVLAVFGMALSVADTIARYMPAGLLYGYARTVLTAQADGAGASKGPMPAASLLLRLNAAFLGLATAVLLVFGDRLLHRLAPALGGGLLTASTVALVLLLQAQALRLMASLVVHVRSDNRPILWANLATLPVPLAVMGMVPAWGLAAAVFGAWLLELTYTGVTLRVAGLRVRQLAGPGRHWACVAWALTASAAVGGGLRFTLPAGLGLSIGIPLMSATYAAVLWHLRPLERSERRMLVRLRPVRRAAQ